MEYVWVVENDGDIGIYRTKDTAIIAAQQLGFDLQNALDSEESQDSEDGYWDSDEGGFDGLSGVYCRRAPILDEGE